VKAERFVGLGPKRKCSWQRKATISRFVVDEARIAWVYRIFLEKNMPVALVRSAQLAIK